VAATCLLVIVDKSPASGDIREFTYGGQTFQELDIPPSPPPPDRIAVSLPEPSPNSTAGIKILPDMPAFDWCYGCSPTAVGMLMGYYDRIGYDKIYTGPANGGVCPADNSGWGSGQCPIAASHQGVDGRNGLGHVDDYWIAAKSCANDPYITGNWTRHSSDCAADFMGTSQTAWGECDGHTLFCLNGGARVYDWTGWEPTKRDGTHGIRLFVESRGYTVTENYNQGITTGSSGGFTFQDYVSEIDSGCPVLLQLTNHTMVGYGYDAANRLAYVRDTWDRGSHTMAWGGSYGTAGTHIGVSVIHLAPLVCATPSLMPDSGHYLGPMTISMCVSTPGAEIHYTTNGAEPTANDATADGPISLSQSCIVKAIAVKANCVSSAVSSSSYTIYPAVSAVTAKLNGDGAEIGLRDVVVTETWPNAFFVETDDRVAGIRVDMPEHGISAGTRLEVMGKLRTVDGERCIEAAHIRVTGTGNVAPIYMTCRDLGGVGWFYDSSSGGGQRGMPDGRGPNNIGLLVSTCGSFSPASSTRFRVTDATGCAVECIVPSGFAIDPTWEFVRVTGVSGCESLGGDMVRRVLRIGGQHDVVSLRAGTISRGSQ